MSAKIFNKFMLYGGEVDLDGDPTSGLTYDITDDLDGSQTTITAQTEFTWWMDCQGTAMSGYQGGRLLSVGDTSDSVDTRWAIAMDNDYYLWLVFTGDGANKDTNYYYRAETAWQSADDVLCVSFSANDNQASFWYGNTNSGGIQVSNMSNFGGTDSGDDTYRGGNYSAIMTLATSHVPSAWPSECNTNISQWATFWFIAYEKSPLLP